MISNTQLHPLDLVNSNCWRMITETDLLCNWGCRVYDAGCVCYHDLVAEAQKLRIDSQAFYSYIQLIYSNHEVAFQDC